MIIYLVFTADGFADIKESIVEKNATLWINIEILSEEELSTLKSAQIPIYFFTETIEPNNEKSVLSAINSVEKTSPNAELFVEYM